MPKIPTNIVRRIVCRTMLVKVDGYWFVKCFDQGGNRYFEADFTMETREEARAEAMYLVNKSQSAQEE